jgi:hypothetical protein
MDVNKLDNKVYIVLLGIILYFLNIYKWQDGLLINILVTTFCLALFDVFLKNILLFNITDNYYIFIVNNIITILTINIMFYIFKQKYDKISFTNLINIAFSCLFYETIIFKLYNYNNLCNNKLRVMTKTIMRLATVHILSNYLNDSDFDKKWFDFALAQITNYSLFNAVFEN